MVVEAMVTGLLGAVFAFLAGLDMVLSFCVVVSHFDSQREQSGVSNEHLDV